MHPIIMGMVTALVVCCFASAGQADELPPTTLSYRIEVRIDPVTRELTGVERITWKNIASQPIDKVPIHLYLNAFAHRGTTWMREGFLRKGSFDELLDKYPDPWGYSELEAIVQLPSKDADSGKAATFEAIQPDDGNRLDRTLIEVTLPDIVEPGQNLHLRIVFKARLPVPIARTGCVPDFCLLGQWFPKIGVLEVPGVRHAASTRWAARQFHGPTEFYADFADFDVTIDAPGGWKIGATGKSDGTDQAAEGGYRRVRYLQRAVHDFAIAMGSDLHVETHAHKPRGGGPEVAVRYMVASVGAANLPRARAAVEGSLDQLGALVGPYPYRTLTVVMPPARASQTFGMEYPTLITGIHGDPLWERFPFAKLRFYESVLVHEFGHQYFYGLLASNEQVEAFLDEGFNSYWDTVNMPAIFGAKAPGGYLLGRALDSAELRAFGLANIADKIREPIRKRPASLFYPGSHGAQIYSRSAMTFRTAERMFGHDKTRKIFADYYAAYRFRHPDTEDFLAVAADSGGDELTAFLREAFMADRVPDYVVAEVTVERHEAPLGRIITSKGPITVTRENRDQYLAPDNHAMDEGGQVWAEVTDPGFVDHDEDRFGVVRWLALAPKQPLQPGGGAIYYESRVRLEGPGWKHLPVDVLLTFDDGVRVVDRWDGRASWRSYRVIRAAKLVDVRIDPERKIYLDVTPQNNALASEPDSRLSADWSLWSASVAQWLAGSVSLWL